MDAEGWPVRPANLQVDEEDEVSNIKLESGRFLRIDEIFIFVAIQPDGEGIMGMKMSNGDWMPFVGADLEGMDVLKKLADISGVKYEIRYFKSMGMTH